MDNTFIISEFLFQPELEPEEATKIHHQQRDQGQPNCLVSLTFGQMDKGTSWIFHGKVH